MKYLFWKAPNFLPAVMTAVALLGALGVVVSLPEAGPPDSSVGLETTPVQTPDADGVRVAQGIPSPTPALDAGTLEDALAEDEAFEGAEERVPLFLQSGAAQLGSRNAGERLSEQDRANGFSPGGAERFDEGSRLADGNGAGPFAAPSVLQALEARERQQARAQREAVAAGSGKSGTEAARSTSPQATSERVSFQRTATIAELPVGDEPPPPSGRAFLRTGSIPVEQSLRIGGEPMNSFLLRQRVFTPGSYPVRIESSRGCIEFVIQLRADEIVYVVWDFELKSWRSAERVGAQGRSRYTPSVQSCQESP